MDNEELYKETLEAIYKLHSDRSVSIEKAIENMKGLRDKIEILIDALESDKNSQEEE